jgi:hypothetical protein
MSDPNLEFEFEAPSGNQAFVTITTLNGKTLADLGWRVCPPSAEDIAAAQRAIEVTLQLMTGHDFDSLGHKVFVGGEEELWKADRRKFFGGGEG